MQDDYIDETISCIRTEELKKVSNVVLKEEEIE